MSKNGAQDDEEDSDFVMSPRDLALAMIKPNVPTIVVESGNDGGKMVVGLLRSIAFGEDDRIVKVAIQIDSPSEIHVIDFPCGCHVIQGEYANRHYEIRLLEQRRFMAKPIGEIIRDQQYVGPGEFMRAVAKAAGDDDDGPGGLAH